MSRIDPALVVVLAGVSAALHVAKLPPALPVLQQQLGISLVEAGFLLSLVQLAGMTLGLVAGLAADTLGLRRSMIGGLLLLCAASLLGGWAKQPASLLVLRAAEGLGFLLASMPAPGLIRRLVSPSRMTRMLGLWGAYMPMGTAIAFLLGPGVIAWAGWASLWWLLALLSLVMAAWVWVAVPADGGHAAPAVPSQARGRIVRTLTSAGPWLAASTFAAYSAQWLAVIGFLPSIYAQGGLAAGWAALATSLAAGVNMIGNVVSGRLLHRGIAAHRLLHAGLLAMILGAFLIFAPLVAQAGAWAGAWRYGGVLLFSLVGGLVPGTLFALSVRLAPDDGTLSTTVGWMQQWSSMGQFLGPPAVAWVVARQGSWDAVWLVTGGFAVAGILTAMGIAALLRDRTAGRNVAPL